MTSHVTTHHPSAGRNRKLGRRAAQLVATIAFTMLALLNTSLVSPAEAAGKLCGDRDQILKRLEQGHDERPQALGLSADGGVLEILVSPEGGWTILVTYPKRPTCVVAVGEAWQMLQLVGQPA
ncbi:MAG TPA: hypothetical protein VLE23_05500 [Geminicoccaceae bacterium]|nr:hypothetical protein [Geminicoccaceae bacterium]